MSRRLKPLDLARQHVVAETDQLGFELRYMDDFIGSYSSV